MHPALAIGKQSLLLFALLGGVSLALRSAIPPISSPMGDYEVVYSSQKERHPGERFTLLKAGRPVYESEAESWGFAHLTRDLSGDGRAELVELTDLGGTYPYAVVYVVALEPEPRLLLRRTLCNPRVEDIDGDGRYEILVNDAEVGPHKDYPTYVCRLDPDGLKIAPELMKKLPPPSKSELDSAIEATHRQVDGGETFYYSLVPATELRKLANRWVYSGKAGKVPGLIQAAWPEQEAVRHQFVAAYSAELRASPLWPVLLELNGADLENWMVPTQKPLER